MLLAAGAVVAVGGCHLIGDYEVVAEDTGEELQPRDVANSGVDATDTNVGGDIQKVPDTGRPAEDASDGGGDVREGYDADAGSGDGGTDSGLDADTELPTNTCPGGTDQSYRVRRAEAPPTIDGRCSSTEFGHARYWSVPGPDTEGDSDTSTGVNYTDNEVSCRLVWQPGTPARLHGCCEIEDDEVLSTTEAGDPVEMIYGGGMVRLATTGLKS